MKATVFGTGYVGLVQAAVMAASGHEVVCVDKDAEKIAKLEQGIIPIFEPGLEEIVLTNRKNGRLRFTTDPEVGVSHGLVQFIAVGTPPDEDGAADLKYVLAVADTIGSLMSEKRIVVVKSTVPVGTCDQVKRTIEARLSKRERSHIPFDVASNPEFLKEGSAVSDCLKPDRIILGTASSETEAIMRELYMPQNRNHEKMIVMDVRSAEMTKYAANTLLATKISFINEIANLADILGADIEMVRKGIGSDPRIGYHFIYAGIGYGGSCFPKDVQALIRTGDQQKYDMHLLKAVEARNATQKRVLLDKILRYFDGNVEGRTFALWGLSFKPNTDDMREAPSRAIMESLWEKGASIRAYDPKAMDECRRIYGDRDDLILVEQQEDALDNADALIVATEWKSFSAPDFDEIAAKLKSPVIFDGRNLYDPHQLKRHGLDYFAIGRNGLTSSVPADLPIK